MEPASEAVAEEEGGGGGGSFLSGSARRRWRRRPVGFDLAHGNLPLHHHAVRGHLIGRSAARPQGHDIRRQRPRSPPVYQSRYVRNGENSPLCAFESAEATQGETLGNKVEVCYSSFRCRPAALFSGSGCSPS